MYFEGDLKPVVKRVRPYKTLILNLPARTFGFWVLANTKVNACFEEDNSADKDYVEAKTVESEEHDTFKVKRSVLHKNFDEYTNTPEASVDLFDKNDTNEYVVAKSLVSRLNDLTQDLNKVQELYKNKKSSEKRVKRQIDIEGLKERIQKKMKNRGLILRKHKKTYENQEIKTKFPHILRLSKRNITRRFKKDRLHRGSKVSKNKVSKRNSKLSKAQKLKEKEKLSTSNGIVKAKKVVDIELKSRKRRSADVDQVHLSAENEIETPQDNVKLWKILRKLHTQLKDLSDENVDYTEEDISRTHHNVEYEREDDIITHEAGFIKTTVGNLMRVLSDLNKNLNRFWNGIKLSD